MALDRLTILAVPRSALGALLVTSLLVFVAIGVFIWYLRRRYGPGRPRLPTRTPRVRGNRRKQRKRG